MNNLAFDFDYDVKDLDSSKPVVIQGFANKAVVDRGNDLIPPEAWKLDEFKKNPIIFFNHDRNIPIGKALDVKVTDEGLKIKVRISQSNQGPVPFIRDMIKEKILRTFSVGFDPQGSEEKREDGVNVIKTANLLETSVVSLPMNQESDFDIAKAFKTKSYETVAADILKLKGNMMASQFHDIIGRAQRQVRDFDKKAALKQLADNSGLGMQAVLDILAGVVTPVPEVFLVEFSKIFITPTDWLIEDALWEEDMVGEESVDRGGSTSEKSKEGFESPHRLGSFVPGGRASVGQVVTKDVKAQDGDKPKPIEEALALLIQEGMTEDQAKSVNELIAKAAEEGKIDTAYLVYAATRLFNYIENGEEIDKAVAEVLYLLPQLESVKAELVSLGDGIKEVVNLDTQDETQDNENKQADQGEEANGPTTVIESENKDETDFGNPHLMIAKSQLALIGELSTVQKSLLDEQRKNNELLGELIEVLKSNNPMPREPTEEEEEEAEEEKGEDVELKAKRLRLAKKREMIENFEKRLGNITTT